MLRLPPSLAGAEDSPGDTDASGPHPPPPGWTVSGAFTAVQYGAPGFPSPTVSGAIGGGTNFFSGGTQVVSTGEQIFDVSGAAAEIDASRVSATLSAHLGGFSTQNDEARVTAVFGDASGTALRSIQIGPVTAAERSGEPELTTLLPRSETVAVPAGTRSIRLTVIHRAFEGSYNDGYADNVTLTLAEGDPQLTPAKIGETANAVPTRGTVLVKLAPGTSAARAKRIGLAGGASGFIPLEQASQVPVGSTFDTTRGTVGLTTAASRTTDQQQSGSFRGGRFVLTQPKSNPLTTMSMTGGGLASCNTALPKGGSRKEVVGAARRRRLFSNARGRFRTRGRNSSATVRGTRWTMTDTCKGTLTVVKQGSVRVRDFAKGRTKVVRAGKRYLARAPKRR